MTSDSNVLQSVPLLLVTDVAASVRFYTDGLGFEVTREWVQEGQLRWCRLQRGGASLMLQRREVAGEHAALVEGAAGEGVTLYFICTDAIAIYREVVAKGVRATPPFVGNAMWVTELTDPDGYRLAFESVTDEPEDTEYRGD